MKNEQVKVKCIDMDEEGKGILSMPKSFELKKNQKIEKYRNVLILINVGVASYSICSIRGSQNLSRTSLKN